MTSELQPHSELGYFQKGIVLYEHPVLVFMFNNNKVSCASCRCERARACEPGFRGDEVLNSWQVIKQWQEVRFPCVTEKGVSERELRACVPTPTLLHTECNPEELFTHTVSRALTPTSQPFSQRGGRKNLTDDLGLFYQVNINKSYRKALFPPKTEHFIPNIPNNTHTHSAQM